MNAFAYACGRIIKGENSAVFLNDKEEELSRTLPLHPLC